MSARSRQPSNAADAPGSEGTSSGNVPDDDWVAVGEIVGPFGVRGELKVNPLTDFPERFERTAAVYVGKERTPYAVEGAQIHKRQVLLRLRGVNDAARGEQLRGARLWVPASEITRLPADQFYLHDVIGMRVCHVNGTELGTVEDVMQTGGNDVFVVRMAGSGAQALLPAVKEFVKSVNVAERVVLVDPIPGLFDASSEEAR